MCVQCSDRSWRNFIIRSIVTCDILGLIGVCGDGSPVFLGLRWDGFLIWRVDTGISFGALVLLGTFHFEGSDVHEGVGLVRL